MSFHEGEGVMDPRIAAEWALKKACISVRRHGSCDHPPCWEAKEVHEWLKSAVRLDDTSPDGDPVKGWLIPD